MVERRPWTRPRVEIVGRGFAPGDERLVWPYEVGIHFDDPANPILFAEGSGRAEAGGFQPLQAIRAPQFSVFVTACRCAWLLAMAEEEEQRGVAFLPDEIYERWKQVAHAEQ